VEGSIDLTQGVVLRGAMDPIRLTPAGFEFFAFTDASGKAGPTVDIQLTMARQGINSSGRLRVLGGLLSSAVIARVSTGGFEFSVVQDSLIIDYGLRAAFKNGTASFGFAPGLGATIEVAGRTFGLAVRAEVSVEATRWSFSQTVKFRYTLLGRSESLEVHVPGVIRSLEDLLSAFHDSFKRLVLGKLIAELKQVGEAAVKWVRENVGLAAREAIKFFKAVGARVEDVATSMLAHLKISPMAVLHVLEVGVEQGVRVLRDVFKAPRRGRAALRRDRPRGDEGDRHEGAQGRGLRGRGDRRRVRRRRRLESRTSPRTGSSFLKTCSTDGERDAGGRRRCLSAARGAIAGRGARPEAVLASWTARTSCERCPRSGSRLRGGHVDGRAEQALEALEQVVLGALDVAVGGGDGDDGGEGEVLVVLAADLLGERVELGEVGLDHRGRRDLDGLDGVVEEDLAAGAADRVLDDRVGGRDDLGLLHLLGLGVAVGEHHDGHRGHRPFTCCGADDDRIELVFQRTEPSHCPRLLESSRRTGADATGAVHVGQPANTRAQGWRCLHVHACGSSAGARAG
jgi:hypothetical protein